LVSGGAEPLLSIRAVVFDLYGTLTEDFGRTGHDAVLVQMATVLSLSVGDFIAAWSEASARRTLGDFATVEECITHICTTLGAQPDAERIEAAVEMRVGCIRESLQPRDDAVETLSRLKSLGMLTALIADCSLEVPMLWSLTPFAPLVDSALFSSREGLRKPDLMLYQRACDRLSVAPAECLYVGDGKSRELSGAQAGGMTAVLFAPGSMNGNYTSLEAASWQGQRIVALNELMDLVD
jgi:putative hydrolase of the HAD superfamily